LGHYLQPHLLTPPKALRISRREFEQLKSARNTLVAAFPFEENYDLLLGNYQALEMFALSIAGASLLRRVGGYQEFYDVRTEMNRHMVNLMTSARMFVDQIPQRISACGHDPEPIRAALRARYDATFEYRFMEALRNFVQHRGIAVHAMSFGSSWMPRGDRERQEYSVSCFALRSELADDPKFKKSVLVECPEKVDLLRACRVYLEGLGSAHHLARGLLDASITSARELTARTITRYERFTKTSSLALEAVAENAGKVTERVPVLLKWEEVRIELARRNGSLVNLPRRYVTSASESS
jgi:hypothetical protein